MTVEDKRKTLDRRQVERRAPKRGVNVRHNDSDDTPNWHLPKRIRRGQLERKEK